MFKKSILLYFSISIMFLSAIDSVAQVGSLNATFNPMKFGLSFNSGANQEIIAIAHQSDGKIIIGGKFTTYNGVSINRIARLNTDGSIDNSFNIGQGADGEVHSICIQPDDKIIIGGYFSTINGISKNEIARLNADGTIDLNFDCGAGPFNSGTELIRSIVLQSDGKIIVGGDFYLFNGTSIKNLVRLKNDGTIDAAFNLGSGVSGGSVCSIVLDINNKIIIGGEFNSVNGVSRSRIAKLNTDGSVDNSFDSGLIGPNSTIRSIAVLSGNKFLIGGWFTSYNGVTVNRVAKLNADGTLDNTFNSGTAASSAVHQIRLVNNKIVLGGEFTSFNGNNNKGIVLLNLDGTIDFSFDSNGGGNYVNAIDIQNDGEIVVGGDFTSFSGVSLNRITKLSDRGKLNINFNAGINNSPTGYFINQICLQPDGKIILGGKFTYYNGKIANNVARINPNGSLDTTFNIGIGANNTVFTLALQDDGKILIGGMFTSFNGNNKKALVRINSNGSIDNSFNPSGAGPDLNVYSIIQQPDNKIIIGGAFMKYNGLTANNVARLNSDGSIDGSFTSGLTGSSIWSVLKMLQLTDGKILLGKLYLNPSTTDPIRKFNMDGTIDNTFNPIAQPNGSIYAISKQLDSLILVGGDFTNFGGNSKNRLVRIFKNGALDHSFNTGTGFNGAVTCIAVQNDEKIIVGGDFTSYNGFSVNRLVRLNKDGAIDNSFQSGNGADKAVQDFLFLSTGNLLIAGNFTTYNSISRNQIAEIINDNPLSQCSNLRLFFKNVNDINCSQNVGHATANARFGKSPYQYIWYKNPPTNDSIVNFTTSGIYNCAITDSIGCQTSASLLISATKYLSNSDFSTNLMASAFRKGFAANVALDASNIGCDAKNGQLFLILDANTYFNNATPSPDKISGDTLIWNFSNLQYLSTPFTPKVNVTTSNAAQIGDTIHLRTIITPITGDGDTTNNIKDYYYPVINGYDPNDISVNPRGNCEKNYISNNQTLTYTVRFQNTGNAEAINIAVLDSLSSNLDLNTLRVLASSDTMYTMILPNNVVKFMFDSIMLADSNSNEAASHGYVVFEIKPKANLSNETKIENRADIYFDFNPAVLTNTVFNTITDGSAYPCILTSVENIENKNNTIYPNPSTGIFTLTSSALAQNITVYDQTGRTIMTIIPTQNTTSIDLSNVSNGMYFIQVKSNDNAHVLKAIVQK